MTMHLLGRLSPNRKLRLMIFLVSGLPLVLAGLVFIAYEATVDYSEALRELSQKAAHIAKHVGAPMESDDVLAVKRELALWSIHEDILAAAIYDANGNLIARYVSPGADAAPVLERPKPGVRFEGTQVTDVVPILMDGQRVGIVSLSASLMRGYQRSCWRAGSSAASRCAFSGSSARPRRRLSRTTIRCGSRRTRPTN
jgi:hypothetical protein